MEIEFSSALKNIVQRQLSVTPKHARFIEARFNNIDEKERRVLHQLASWIQQMSGYRLDEFCASYGFLTEILLEEELYFRRHNKYRRSTIEQCERDVYGNQEYMKQYLDGLLLSQIFWSNHTRLFGYYIDEFLSLCQPGERLLEIGPGHGLLLAAAASYGVLDSVTGWDISSSSIDKTAAGLEEIGVSAELCLRNVMNFSEDAGQFDMFVMSELLEHLEQPGELLASMFEAIKPGSRMFISMPVNSPAPDHIYLLRQAEGVEKLIIDAGFQIQNMISAPATNNTLERAIKKNLTISVGVIAIKQ